MNKELFRKGGGGKKMVKRRGGLKEGQWGQTTSLHGKSVPEYGWGPPLLALTIQQIGEYAGKNGKNKKGKLGDLIH